MMPKSYSRTYDASPFYKYQNSGTIAAGASVAYDYEISLPASKKYLPFNLVIVDNNSSSRILFYPNQGTNAIVIPPSTSRSFDRTVIPALSTFKIENDDASNTIAAKEISVSVQRQQADGDSFVKNILYDKILRPFLGAA